MISPYVQQIAMVPSDYLFFFSRPFLQLIYLILKPRAKPLNCCLKELELNSQLGVTYTLNEHSLYSIREMLVATINPRQPPREANSTYLFI